MVPAADLALREVMGRTSGVPSDVFMIPLDLLGDPRDARVVVRVEHAVGEGAH